MKKINYRRVLVSVLWIIAIAGLVSSLAFVSKSEKNIIANSLNISIHNNDENLFLSETDVKEFFKERSDSLLSSRYEHINIPELEKALNSHPAIENAEVSADMNGEIKVEILQRTPVLRIINKSGESYYIDSLSKLMPLNFKSTGRVIVASGFINEPYAKRYNYSVNQIAENKNLKDVTLLDDIYEIS